MYRTNRERISESLCLVARAVYSRKPNYGEIISAFHHLANTLECTGHTSEAAIVDQIISGYEQLSHDQTQLHCTQAGWNDNLKCRLQACRDTLADYVSRLSQDERTQLVSNQPDLFPNGLPSTETVPYIGKQADNTTQI